MLRLRRRRRRRLLATTTHPPHPSGRAVKQQPGAGPVKGSQQGQQGQPVKRWPSDCGWHRSSSRPRSPGTHSLLDLLARSAAMHRITAVRQGLPALRAGATVARASVAHAAPTAAHGGSCGCVACSPRSMHGGSCACAACSMTSSHDGSCSCGACEAVAPPSAVATLPASRWTAPGAFAQARPMAVAPPAAHSFGCACSRCASAPPAVHSSDCVCAQCRGVSHNSLCRCDKCLSGH